MLPLLLSSRNNQLFGNYGIKRNIFYKADHHIVFTSLLCISIILGLLFNVYPVATIPVTYGPHSTNSLPFSEIDSSATGESIEHLRLRGDRAYTKAPFPSKGSTTAPPSVPPVLSLAKACRKEIQLYCEGFPLHPLQCLLEHYYIVRNNDTLRMTDVYSELCYSWLNARDVCVTSLRQQWSKLCGDEGYPMNVRECLRRVPPPLLPEACRESDYYRSVRLAGRLRRQIFGHGHGSMNMTSGEKLAPNPK